MRIEGKCIGVELVMASLEKSQGDMHKIPRCRSIDPQYPPGPTEGIIWLLYNLINDEKRGRSRLIHTSTGIPDGILCSAAKSVCVHAYNYNDIVVLDELWLRGTSAYLEFKSRVLARC